MLWLPILLFLIWFGPLVIWPYVNSLRRGESPPVYTTVLVLFHLAVIPYFWVIGFGWFIFFAPLIPLGTLALVLLDVWDANMFAPIGAAGLLVVISTWILVRLSGWLRAVAPFALVVPVVVIPVLIQGMVGEYQMKQRFAAMQGDCIAIRSLTESLMWHGDPYQSYHALMRKGELVFVWSYRKNDWDELLSSGRRGRSPDPSCN